jgi:hypothetical protein
MLLNNNKRYLVLLDKNRIHDGIAALYAQATGKRGKELWKLLISKASPLSLPSRDVGAGLVQAPF